MTLPPGQHRIDGFPRTNLHWEGVALQSFHNKMSEPSLRPDTSVTHLVFGGLNGYRVAVTIEDALADDVLIAEQLDGRPLDR